MRKVPDRLEIGYSLLAVLPVTAFYVLALAYFVFWLRGLAGGHVIALIMGLFSLVALPLLLVPFLPAMLHAWTHRGPVLVMDLDGVTDWRKKSAHIPWDDIASVERVGSYLVFAFRRPDRQRQDLPLLGPVGVLLNRMRSMSDWNVSLHLLACDKAEALQAAETLRQRSMRREVVAANRAGLSADDPFKGWSGRL